MTESTTKTLPFVAHNSLIKQIIFRQHGEHFKAIVELIQNSMSFSECADVFPNNNTQLLDKAFSANMRGGGW